MVLFSKDVSLRLSHLFIRASHNPSADIFARKSQIAIEYAFRLKDLAPHTSIFWVYTSAGVNFEEAYTRIATECKIPGRNDHLNKVQLVKDWLETTYSVKWLMIIDNVDSVEAFFNKPLHGKPLVEYVPQSAKGSVLYTSRNRDIGVDLTLDRDPVMVSSMSSKEALQMFSKDLTSHSTVEERKALLEELDHLPLAITQAVAYMAKRRKSIG